MITCTFISNTVPAFGRRHDGYFQKYRLHCWSLDWARFDETRVGKNEEGQQEWQLHVSCKVQNETFTISLGRGGPGNPGWRLKLTFTY